MEVWVEGVWGHPPYQTVTWEVQVDNHQNLEVEVVVEQEPSQHWGEVVVVGVEEPVLAHQNYRHLFFEFLSEQVFRVLQSVSPIMTVFAATPHSSGSLPFVGLILPLEPGY